VIFCSGLVGSSLSGIVLPTPGHSWRDGRRYFSLAAHNFVISGSYLDACFNIASLRANNTAAISTLVRLI
jgi:hypothetical protein